MFNRVRSRVNVIDSCSFNQVENVHLLPTSKKMYGYRSTELLPVVVRNFEAEVERDPQIQDHTILYC